MKAITIRDFRTRPKQVQNELAEEPEALLTASGKPMAIIYRSMKRTLTKLSPSSGGHGLSKRFRQFVLPLASKASTS